jgi:23S rRNA pseudouridine2605 synthase
MTMEKMPAKPPRKRSEKPDAGKAVGEKKRTLRSQDEKSAEERKRTFKPGDEKSQGDRKRSFRPADENAAGERKRSFRPADENAAGERKRTFKPAAGKPAGVRKRNVKAAASKAPEELIRLNKYISNSGVCARREADELIKTGHISVNGKKVTDMGVKVKASDTVEYNGKALSPGKRVYILLNKPKGYVTTVKDPHADATVLDLVKDATTERIYPVGRLDKSTTGVLLLTNDGDLAGKLTHPSFGAKKVYHVFTDKEVTRHDMEQIVTGVSLEEGVVGADAISYPEPDDHTQVGLEIHSGQNRVVRRMFEKLGYRVRKLDRVSFAGLTKKNLQRGHWRNLTDKEVSMLKRGIFK